MAEPFNPNEFRKQMAGGQGGQMVPEPVAPPQQHAPQMPAHPQAQQQPNQYVPPPGQRYAAQAPTPNMAQPPQNYSPAQQQMPQSAAPQFQDQVPMAHRPAYVPQQSQMPAQHYASPQGQQFQAQPYQGQNYQSPPVVPADVQQPPAKRGLFRRSKLKSAKAAVEGQAQSLGKKKGLSPLVTFVGGLAFGVLGTLMSIMLFSGGNAEQASVAVKSQVPAIDMAEAQGPLTDEMLLLEEKEGNRQ